MAGDRHGAFFLVFAPQRGLRCMGNGVCMGLSFVLFRCPSPLGDLSHYRLPAVMDVDMLDGHLLLAFAAVPAEGLHLWGECPHKLVRLICWHCPVV